MTDLELNKDLHEKVMGKCWHEWKDGCPGCKMDEVHIICKKCKIKCWHFGHCKHKNPSYTTNPADYWELLQKVKTQERWIEFLNLIIVDGYRVWNVGDIILDMPCGCQAIWEFFCKEEYATSK